MITTAVITVTVPVAVAVTTLVVTAIAPAVIAVSTAVRAVVISVEQNIGSKE